MKFRWAKSGVLSGPLIINCKIEIFAILIPRETCLIWNVTKNRTRKIALARIQVVRNRASAVSASVIIWNRRSCPAVAFPPMSSAPTTAAFRPLPKPGTYRWIPGPVSNIFERAQLFVWQWLRKYYGKNIKKSINETIIGFILHSRVIDAQAYNLRYKCKDPKSHWIRAFPQRSIW